MGWMYILYGILGFWVGFAIALVLTARDNRDLIEKIRRSNKRNADD